MTKAEAFENKMQALDANSVEDNAALGKLVEQMDGTISDDSHWHNVRHHYYKFDDGSVYDEETGCYASFDEFCELNGIVQDETGDWVEA